VLCCLGRAAHATWRAHAGHVSQCGRSASRHSPVEEHARGGKTCHARPMRPYIRRQGGRQAAAVVLTGQGDRTVSRQGKRQCAVRSTEPLPFSGRYRASVEVALRACRRLGVVDGVLSSTTVVPPSDGPNGYLPVDQRGHLTYSVYSICYQGLPLIGTGVQSLRGKGPLAPRSSTL